jgi:hypothetical protein
MKRLLFLVVLVAMGSLAAAVVMAAPSHHAASPATTLSSAQPALDPYLGGPIESRVPMAHFCQDYGQCDFTPPGDPCDTPRGCVCGYSSGRLRCGRF